MGGGGVSLKTRIGQLGLPGPILIEMGIVGVSMLDTFGRAVKSELVGRWVAGGVSFKTRIGQMGHPGPVLIEMGIVGVSMLDTFGWAVRSEFVGWWVAVSRGGYR